MLDIFIDRVIRWRWWIILFSTVILLFIASGARFLGFDNSYRVFFKPDNPQLMAFDALQNTYTKSDNVLFAIAPKDGNVFTADTLAAIQELTAAAWKIPYSTRVDSVTNYQHTEVKGDNLTVSDLVAEPQPLTPDQLAKVRDIALHEPLLVDQSIAPRGDVTGINVTIDLPKKSPDEESVVTQYARQLIQDVESRHPNIKIYLNGMVPFSNAFGEASMHDMQTLVPLMYGVIMLVALFTLRSFSGALATMLVIMLSIVAAMGVTGWLGIKLTPPSASAPTVIMTLAVADCIHILSSMFHYMREGMNKQQALAASLKLNMMAVSLTSLTTIIGFLTLNFSAVPPFRDLGNITAIGITFAWLFSIILLPALIMILPVRVKAQKDITYGWTNQLGAFVVRCRKPLLWGMALSTLVLIAFIPRNEMNDQFSKYFDPSMEIRQSTDFITQRLAGTDMIEYSLPASGSGGINEPAYLQQVEIFANWYRAQPGVTHVSAITDVVKRLNKNMHGDDPAYYRVPESRDLAAQYLLLYEMSLPFGLDLNDQISVDKSATRMRVVMRDLSSREFIALESRAQAWLHEHTPTIASIGTGPTLMFAHIGQLNISSMISGNLVALVLVSGLLLIALRSWRIGLISLIPNLIPIGMAFGVWGIFVGNVGLSLAVVTSLTFGIVVDDTIHFLSKYLHARRELKQDAETAVRYAFNTVGSAMWSTSIILVAGFSILALSDFKLNSDMGMLSALTIAIALATDYFLLAPLLMKYDRSKS